MMEYEELSDTKYNLHPRLFELLAFEFKKEKYLQLIFYRRWELKKLKTTERDYSRQHAGNKRA